jgi:acetyltransferase-like isoleucine patch superfamily enzyme
MAIQPTDSDSLKKYGSDQETLTLLNVLKRLVRVLILEKKDKYKRFLSIADYIIDRWERADLMGFGKGSSVYDSCLVLGDVAVGENTWIGPYTILDGSGGGLSIGANCTISAGVHLYTHDTVDKVINKGKTAVAPVEIGDNVYIGPNTIVSKGVNVGSYVVIGANSFVNRSIPSGAKAFGTPAKVVGYAKEI